MIVCSAVYRATILLSILVVIAVFASCGDASKPCDPGNDPEESSYSYKDDFSTDKVMSDKDTSSVILYYNTPEAMLGGCLVLWPEYMWPQFDETLLFLRGFDPYAEALLSYHFPVNKVERFVSGGTVSFYAEPILANGTELLVALVRYENDDVQLLDSVTTFGHRTYALSPPDSSRLIELSFGGHRMILDDLAVDLQFE